MFITYAQNFEDVLLWRALKHVEAGFYIDVGANSPTLYSVSLAFYERGWRGVHVEPIPFYAAELRASRPDEEVVEAAISSREGSVSLFDIPNTGLATGVQQVAEMHQANGFEFNKLEVKAIRLSTLLDKYLDIDVHWLKIDVEGMEKDVIESWLPSKVRPWVVVVESTEPLSPELNHSEWEPQLLMLGYKFAHFDGLNRFYVHENKIRLKDALRLGPNIFDDFAISSTSCYGRKLNADIADRDAQIAKLHETVEIGSFRVIELEHRVIELEQNLSAVYASSSWRITQPIRGIKRGIDDKLSWERQRARVSFDRVMEWTFRHPHVRSTLKRVVAYLPPVKRRLLANAENRSGTSRGMRACKHWMLDPDPVVLREWEKLLNRRQSQRNR